jgi:hypothetical protein
MMKSAPATPTDRRTLTSDVAYLTVLLADAERAAIDPQTARIATIRAELGQKQQALIAVEEAEADAQRQAEADGALRVAESEVENAKSELNRRSAEYVALPDLIQRAQFRFNQALAALALAKSAVERNNP